MSRLKHDLPRGRDRQSQGTARRREGQARPGAEHDPGDGQRPGRPRRLPAAQRRARQGHPVGQGPRADRPGGRPGERVRLLPGRPLGHRQDGRADRRPDPRQPARHRGGPEDRRPDPVRPQGGGHRGRVSDGDLDEVREAGFDDAAIAEVVANVALNIFTNYFNNVAETDIDFPKAPALTPEPATTI